MKPYWLGLDIGGTKCAVVLATVDRGIHLQDKILFPTLAEKGFEDTYGRLNLAIEALMLKHDLTAENVEAIGISCGGPLDSRTGMVLYPPNLPGWVNIPIVQMLTERYGVPAYLLNDANACALVEWKLGAGQGSNDMIFLTMGTGMGGGVIAEGQLLRGVSDMGGEIGHLRLTEDGPVGFGKAGSFEGWTSGGGIQRQAQAMTKKLIAEGNPPQWADAPEEEINAKLLAGYARQGDPQAIAFFDHIGTMLGRGLALLTDSFNPGKIVIGSIFVRCEDLLRPAMEKALAKDGIPEAVRELKVVPAATGEALGDLASIMVALHARGVDPYMEADEQEARVLAHYERLFARYPVLEGSREEIMQAYLCLRRCYEKGGKVMIVGNGGSCADAEHIVGELMKGFYLKRPLDAQRKAAIAQATQELLPKAADLFQQGLPAIALSNHAALSTAVQNDLDPLLAPAQQVLALGKSGDVVIGISTSGNAKNVALTVSTAKALGMETVGLAGGSGGQLKTLCDHAIVVPGNTPADVQELHLPVYHTLCAMLEARFFGEAEKK